MCFRFNAIRQLSAAESECDNVWIGHHENHPIAIISVQRGKHIHIESRVRRRRLLEASDRRGKSKMEQRRNTRNRLAVLNRTSLNLLHLNDTEREKHSMFDRKDHRVNVAKVHFLWCETIFALFLVRFSIDYQMFAIWTKISFVLHMCAVRPKNQTQNGN